MFLLQRSNPVGGDTTADYFIVSLIVIVILSLLINTAVLRFAADLIVQRMPKFSTAFFISFFCLLAGFIVRLIVSRINKPRINSVLEADSFNSQAISFLPLSVFLLICWILNSQYLTDSAAKAVGYKNGLFITGLQIVFLMLIGLLISAVFFFWQR